MSFTSTPLKPNPLNILKLRDLSLRSDILEYSTYPADTNIRTISLKDIRAHNKSHAGVLKPKVPPPLISCSPFVPRPLITHLMRNKKNSALGVKFVRARGDQITDMEGAMHTFVTPVVPKCEMVGDYIFTHMHNIAKFGESPRHNIASKESFHVVRTVVMSASIQMDFELSKVMMRVSKLGTTKTIGHDLLTDANWKILDTQSKQNDKLRTEYDEALRKHMIYHLTTSHTLPSRTEASTILTPTQTTALLESLLKTPPSSPTPTTLSPLTLNKFTDLPSDQILSLELLLNTSIQQTLNELSALELLCPQGYIYTYDPASIFAAQIGSPILNRLYLLALAHLSNHHTFTHMRAFAFNDYADPGILPLLRIALAKQTHVRVLRKSELFRGKDGGGESGKGKGREGGLYDASAVKGGEGALLVIHNNSDGFGQNIETEGMGGSLDGVVGSCSDAAASLERGRGDLLDFVW